MHIFIRQTCRWEAETYVTVFALSSTVVPNRLTKVGGAELALTLNRTLALLQSDFFEIRIHFLFMYCSDGQGLVCEYAHGF